MSGGGATGASTSAAEAYDRHVGRYGAQLAAGLVDVAGIRSGQRALDVGCGPGPLTRVLAEPRVPGADVRVGTGEHLPFATGEFDVVLAQLVVQLMEDRDAGVREMARVARPGGVVAACVWDWETMPLLRSFWDAALAVAPERAGALSEGERVGYRRPEELAALWEAAGLLKVSTGELGASVEYDSFDELFRPFEAGAGRSGACFGSLEAADRRRLRDTAREILGEPDGSFRLAARAWSVRGLAPGP